VFGFSVVGLFDWVDGLIFGGLYSRRVIFAHLLIAVKKEVDALLCVCVACTAYSAATVQPVGWHGPVIHVVYQNGSCLLV
jgi:hypothetical protein